MVEFQFSGIEKIDKEDFNRIKDILNKEISFLERELKAVNSIRVHFKRHNVGGRVKWTTHIFVDWPNKKIITVEGVKWNIIDSVHEAVKKLKNEVNHLLKGETSYKKNYY